MEEREVKLEVQKAKANEEEDDGEWELQNLGVEEKDPITTLLDFLEALAILGAYEPNFMENNFD